MMSDIKNRVDYPVRLTIADDTPMTPQVIAYFLQQNQTNLQRYRILGNYYKNKTAIQSRRLSDSDKENNRISHSFARYISRIATAFFMGLGMRYTIKPKAYKQALMAVLEDGGITRIQHYEEAIEASKCGIAYELLYFSPEGKPKSKFYAASDMMLLFSQTPNSFISYAMRPYTVSSIDKHTPAVEYVDIYDKETVAIWKRSGGKQWQLVEQFSHGFTDVPVIVRINSTDLSGDYEMVIPQIDGYDKGQSDTANDLDYFSDAYLNLIGIDDLTSLDDEGNERSSGETAKLMRQNRMLFSPQGCKAEFVTKNVNDAQAEHHKNRLFNDIFFLSQVPNLADESFSGNLSGVALKYKLFGLDELVIEKEQYFIAAELKKVRLLTDYINQLHNTDYDWRDVSIKFDRSAISNRLEIAQIINLMRGLMSDQTLISMYPGVKDAAAELKIRNKEQATTENLDGDDEGVF